MKFKIIYFYNVSLVKSKTVLQLADEINDTEILRLLWEKKVQQRLMKQTNDPIMDKLIQKSKNDTLTTEPFQRLANKQKSSDLLNLLFSSLQKNDNKS